MRKTTTIRVDPALWKEFQIQAIRKKSSSSDLLEELITQYLQAQQAA